MALVLLAKRRTCIKNNKIYLAKQLFWWTGNPNAFDSYLYLSLALFIANYKLHFVQRRCSFLKFEQSKKAV